MEIYITEEQAKKLAAQDQVKNKVNAGVMDNICGGMCESIHSTQIQKWYRGFNSKYGNLGTRGDAIWVADNPYYAKSYAEMYGDNGRLAEVTIDTRRLNPCSIFDFDVDEDIYDVSNEAFESLRNEGYNAYYLDYDSSESEGLCLFSFEPIVNVRIFSQEEYDSTPNIDQYLDDEINEGYDYMLGTEGGNNDYFHVMEENTNENDFITLYHGLKMDSLEYACEEGALMPRVCSEGGPKAVWLSEKCYEYPCSLKFKIPVSEIGRWGNGKFEQISNVDYITLSPLPLDEYECEMIKLDGIKFDDELRAYWRQRFDNDDYKFIKYINSRFEDYPAVWVRFVEPIVFDLSESKKKNAILKESPDSIEKTYLSYDDENSFPFIIFKGFPNEVVVGLRGQTHWDIISSIYHHKDAYVSQELYDAIESEQINPSLTDAYEAWGRYFGNPKNADYGGNIISFYSSPSVNNFKNLSKVLRLVIDEFKAIGINIDENTLDYDDWIGSVANRYPVKWIWNGIAETIVPLSRYIKKFEKTIEGKPIYVVHAKNGTTIYMDVNGFVVKNDFLSLAENKVSEINPDEINLDSFKLKKQLNPKIWKNNKLDSRIRMKLLDIADDFIEFLGIDWVDYKDITITGSLANYNWSEEHSDIDLHIIIDYSDVDERTDFVDNYFYSQKTLWNKDHKDLNIYGYPVEVFVQNAETEHDSSGVYSLEKDRWIVEPDLNILKHSKISKRFIKEQVADYINEIDKLLYYYKKNKQDSHKMEKLFKKATKLFDKIKAKRKEGFEKSNGKEINNHNICFKLLRRMGYIEKLQLLKLKTYNKLGSLE